MSSSFANFNLDIDVQARTHFQSSLSLSSLLFSHCLRCLSCPLRCLICLLFLSSLCDIFSQFLLLSSFLCSFIFLSLLLSLHLSFVLLFYSYMFIHPFIFLIISCRLTLLYSLIFSGFLLFSSPVIFKTDT